MPQEIHMTDNEDTAPAGRMGPEEGCRALLSTLDAMDVPEGLQPMLEWIRGAVKAMMEEIP